MNIRLVGAALLLLSTLSLSPIAEAQTGGVSTTFRVSGQVTNPVIFNLAKLQKFAVSTQNVTFFAAGQVTSGSYTGALLWDVLQSAGIKFDPNANPPINQSARLAGGRCSCYVRSVGCEEHDMRLMMQGLTDAAFEQRFGAEDACLAALAAARQAAGMACPRCGNPKSYVYGRRVGCTRCNQRWSVTSGTVMADTKLPLTHWFRAMHLMTSTKQGISAIELGRRLGVSYPTAWYLHKRLRHAMTERGARHVLGAAPADGGAHPTVEADDVYLGGERNQGRGTAGKTRVIAACERQADGAMGYVVMKVVASFSAEHVAAFRDAHIAHGAHIHTDGLRGFPAFADPATQRTHQVTVTASKRPDRARGSAFFWINTAIANLSTAIKATYKAPSPKHLPDYLGAFCWTTNHRKNMRGMISAACRAIATSTALSRKTVYAPPVGAIG